MKETGEHIDDIPKEICSTPIFSIEVPNNWKVDWWRKAGKESTIYWQYDKNPFFGQDSNYQQIKVSFGTPMLSINHKRIDFDNYTEIVEVFYDITSIKQGRLYSLDSGPIMDLGTPLDKNLQNVTLFEAYSSWIEWKRFDMLRRETKIDSGTIDVLWKKYESLEDVYTSGLLDISDKVGISPEYVFIIQMYIHEYFTDRDNMIMQKYS